MVAMGSSLADRAWGRESAVYRISGVTTVVAGWFITALGGFLIAFAVGLVLIYGKTPAFIIVTVLCGWMLVRSNLSRKGKGTAETQQKPQQHTLEDIIQSLRNEVCMTMECATKIYDRTLLAVMKENRKELRNLVKEANDRSTNRANANTRCCRHSNICKRAMSTRPTTTCKSSTI